MRYEIQSEAGGEIIKGDCLETSGEIEPGSVDLILTDPPYGTVKGVASADGIEHGMKGQTDWDDALPPSTLFDLSKQLLRKNGKAVLFAQEPYTSELVTEAGGNLSFSYRMVWEKDHFANSLVAKDSPVNLFEDIVVFTKQADTAQTHPLRPYAQRVMEHIGLTLPEINKELGHRRAEHFFYVDSSQFELCTRETYNELVERFGIDSVGGFKEYAELQEMDEAFKQKNPSVFNLPDGEKYKTNVYHYDKPQSDYHPTQKPVGLLMDLIETFSNEGDRVVDLTAGSGSTAVAAYKTNRECIAIEKDEIYYQKAIERMSNIDDSQVSVTGQYNLEAYND